MVRAGDASDADVTVAASRTGKFQVAGPAPPLQKGLANLQVPDVGVPNLIGRYREDALA